jgi:hypothetical protein
MLLRWPSCLHCDQSLFAWKWWHARAGLRRYVVAVAIVMRSRGNLCPCRPVLVLACLCDLCSQDWISSANTRRRLRDYRLRATRQGTSRAKVRLWDDDDKAEAGALWAMWSSEFGPIYARLTSSPLFRQDGPLQLLQHQLCPANELRSALGRVGGTVPSAAERPKSLDGSETRASKI